MAYYARQKFNPKLSFADRTAELNAKIAEKITNIETNGSCVLIVDDTQRDIAVRTIFNKFPNQLTLTEQADWKTGRTTLIIEKVS